MRTRTRLLRSAALVAALLVSERGRAAESEPPGALAERLSPALSERLLRSDSLSERLRGIERLGDIATPRALDSLLRLAQPDARGRSAQERLAVVRALWPHARLPQVRQALVRLMTGAARRPAGRGASLGVPVGTEPLEELVRSAAALALAAARDEAALLALGSALRQEGPVADAAAAALVTHPPRDLGPLLGSRGMPSRTLVRMLADLGDQRAYTALRRFVERGSPEIRAEAALALTRLGTLETVEVARYWLAHEREPALRTSAAEMLALAHARDWPEAIAALIARPETRDAGLDLALRAPHPRLAPALERVLASGVAEPERALAALGRTNGGRAARVLGRELAGPNASHAAYALSLMEHDAATTELERALRDPRSRVLALYAAVVRARVLELRVGGLERQLEAALASRSPELRAAGAWGLAALDDDRARDLLGARDPIVVRAAARNAARGEPALAGAARLATERDLLTSAALALCLADRGAAASLPNLVLERLIGSVPAAAPLAVRALAARDPGPEHARASAWLEDDDAQIRAHAALGLADNDSPAAVALLARRYRFEAVPEVRRAIVIALSARPERARLRTLRQAAALDADAETRNKARLAAAGQRLQAELDGTGTFWLRITDGEGLAGDVTGAAPGAPPALATAVQLRASTGLLLPLTSDPAGLVVLVGLPAGLVRMRLAGAPGSNKAWAR